MAAADAHQQKDAQLQEAAFKKLYSEEYYERCDCSLTA